MALDTAAARAAHAATIHAAQAGLQEAVSQYQAGVAARAAGAGAWGTQQASASIAQPLPKGGNNGQ
jgi:hypothetical protein